MVNIQPILKFFVISLLLSLIVGCAAQQVKNNLDPLLGNATYEHFVQTMGPPTSREQVSSDTFVAMWITTSSYSAPGYATYNAYTTTINTYGGGVRSLTEKLVATFRNGVFVSYTWQRY